MVAQYRLGRKMVEEVRTQRAFDTVDDGPDDIAMRIPAVGLIDEAGDTPERLRVERSSQVMSRAIDVEGNFVGIASQEPPADKYLAGLKGHRGNAATQPFHLA